MSSAIHFVQLPSAISPREILEEDFPYLAPLPIKGGWGYSMQDPFVIDAEDPRIERKRYDFVGLEYAVAEHRLYEELIAFPAPGKKYAGVRQRLQQQSLHQEGERAFDRLILDVQALREEDFLALKEAWEGPRGYAHPEFDKTAHEERRAALSHTGVAEFWFDITSFFGRF